MTASIVSQGLPSPGSLSLSTLEVQTSVTASSKGVPLGSAVAAYVAGTRIQDLYGTFTIAANHFTASQLSSIPKGTLIFFRPVGKQAINPISVLTVDGSVFSAQYLWLVQDTGNLWTWVSQKISATSSQIMTSGLIANERFSGVSGGSMVMYCHNGGG